MTTADVVRDQGHGWCAVAECLVLATWLCGRGRHWVCLLHRAPMDKKGYGDNRCARCIQESE